MYEFLIQYVESPMWTVPLQEFMEKHCEVVDAQDPGAKQKVFEEYLQLVDRLEGTLQAEIGVDKDKYKAMLKVGVKLQGYGHLFRDLFLLRDQEVFTKKMVTCNKALEMEAMMQMQEAPQDLERMQLEKQARDLDLAIQMSLAMEDDHKTQSGQEEQQLLEAIANSLQTFDAEKEKQKEEILHSLPPLQQK